MNTFWINYLKDLGIFTILLLITILIHELSHIIHHKVVLKKWPRFGVTKYLFFYVVIDGEMTLFQRMMNILIAIFAGLVVAVSLGNVILWISYMVACFWDIKIFIELWRLSDRYGFHRNMFEVIEFDKDK